eukprot:1195974-Prorocentrum_minimum.AAC.4
MWVGVDAIVPVRAGGRVGPGWAGGVLGQGAAANVAGAAPQVGAPTSAAVGDVAHDDGGAAVSLISLVAGGDQGGLDADVHEAAVVIKRTRHCIGRFGGEFSQRDTTRIRETSPQTRLFFGREGGLCLWWEGLLAVGEATRLALAALGYHDEATEDIGVEGRDGIRVAFHICSGLRLQMPVGLRLAVCRHALACVG